MKQTALDYLENIDNMTPSYQFLIAAIYWGVPLIVFSIFWIKKDKK